MSGVIWSSMKAMRSRNCNLRFFSRCSRNKSGAGDWCNASIAASRSRCSCCKRASSVWSSRSSSSVMVYLNRKTQDEIANGSETNILPVRAVRKQVHESRADFPDRNDPGRNDTHLLVWARSFCKPVPRFTPGNVSAGSIVRSGSSFTDRYGEHRNMRARVSMPIDRFSTWCKLHSPDLF